MKQSASSGWGIAVLSILGLASSMAIRVYFNRGYIESPMLDAIKSLFFRGNPGEQTVQAPPFINLSQASLVLDWALMTGIVAVAVLARASLARRGRPRGQPQAVAIVVSLLALYCLWHSWPMLADLYRHS